jgi:hypothetical protein
MAGPLFLQMGLASWMVVDMNWGFLTICILAGIGIGIDSTRWGEMRQVAETPMKTFISALILLVLVLWAMHWSM